VAAKSRRKRHPKKSTVCSNSKLYRYLVIIRTTISSISQISSWWFWFRMYWSNWWTWFM